jgi:hypothetical protein
MKTIDLTIRQILKICSEHINDKCAECPLYDSQIKCYEFDPRTHTYNLELLVEEEVNVRDN